MAPAANNLRAVTSGAKKVAQVAAANPSRTLFWLSVGSGFLLIVGGISGLFTINPLAFVISFYNIIFGLLIVLTELKNFPIIKTFQKSVDKYFHLLSVPRGKGGFYCFIGFLAFFSSEWNLSRVCVLIVSIVGIVHLFHCKRCGAQDEELATQGAQQSQPMESFTESGSCSASSTEAPSSWAGLMKQVVSESPEMTSQMTSMAVSAGIQYAASGGGGGGGGAGAGAGSAAAGGGGSGIDGVPQSTMKG